MTYKDFGKHLSVSTYWAGNGAKTFGAQVWYNSQRVGFELSFGLGTFTILWDF